MEGLCEKSVVIGGGAGTWESWTCPVGSEVSALEKGVCNS